MIICREIMQYMKFTKLWNYKIIKLHNKSSTWQPTSSTSHFQVDFPTSTFPTKNTLPLYPRYAGARRRKRPTHKRKIILLQKTFVLHSNEKFCMPIIMRDLIRHYQKLNHRPLFRISFGGAHQHTHTHVFWFVKTEEACKERRTHTYVLVMNCVLATLRFAETYCKVSCCKVWCRIDFRRRRFCAYHIRM